MINRAAENLLGYQADDVLGDADLSSYFPKQFVDMIVASFLGRGLEDTRLVAQETSIVSNEGEVIPVRFSGVLLFSNEKIAGAVGFYQDLRAFKQLEREKRDADRLAIVGQTVAGLAHGIKNVLQGLEGGLFVVETAIEDNDKSLLDRGWEMLRRNIGRISALVHDLLDYSKAREPEFEKTDPNALAEEVCALFDLKAAAHSTKIMRVFDPAVEEIYLEQRGIHTCLSNLISNAIDACEMDKSKSQHEIVVKTSSDSDWGVVFEVSDNGIGMDEQTKSRVFSNFFSTKGSKGTGLGLLVTSKIVEEHEGTMAFESEPGVGTTFTIKLPRKAMPSESAAETKIADSSTSDSAIL